MTDEEKVLKEYPDAFYYSTGLREYWIMDGPEMIGYGDTEAEAWQNAAKNIEHGKGEIE